MSSFERFDTRATHRRRRLQTSSSWYRFHQHGGASDKGQRRSHKERDKGRSVHRDFRNNKTKQNSFQFIRGVSLYEFINCEPRLFSRMKTRDIKKISYLRYAAVLLFTVRDLVCVTLSRYSNTLRDSFTIESSFVHGLPES